MKEKPIVLTLGFWLAVGILIYSIWYIFFSLPNPLFHDPYSKVLMDRDNQLLSARVAQDGQWRFPIVDTLSEKYSKAVIAFEDKRFRKHNGVDGKALCRAALQNIQSGTIVSGGSTITMQLIRMASKTPPRTILQKVREVILATRLEWTWSKDHILQSYASHAPFGGNVVGIEAATWRYFGKNALSISWAEAALLAVLPNNPSMLHPGRGRKPLLAKRNRLLNSLFEAGTIDNITLETALSEPIPPAPRPLPNLAPHLTDRLTSEQSEINNGVFRTTIDKSLQENLNALA
ncbi:MAG: transglycosylase domain-containing protein, partial [Saprospiraceae bacterium]|nr:transglycosylase domain-containing protein [Saprospiraceae bacterium]